VSVYRFMETSEGGWKKKKTIDRWTRENHETTMVR